MLSVFYCYFTWLETISMIKLLEQKVALFSVILLYYNFFLHVIHINFFQDTGVIYFSDLKIKTAKCEDPWPRPYCEFCFLHFCKRNTVFPSEWVASWLVRSSPDRVVRVRALAGGIVFLSKTLYSHSASLHPGV